MPSLEALSIYNMVLGWDIDEEIKETTSKILKEHNNLKIIYFYSCQPELCRLLEAFSRDSGVRLVLKLKGRGLKPWVDFKILLKLPYLTQFLVGMHCPITKINAHIHTKVLKIYTHIYTKTLEMDTKNSHSNHVLNTGDPLL